MNGKKIIGLIGLPGTGKTTVAKYFKSKGFVHIVLSDIIKTQMVKEGKTIFTRKNLQDYGNKIRHKLGPGALVYLAHQKIQRSKKRKFIIDGIRNIGEIEYLRSKTNAFLISVVAQRKIRFKRLINKGRKKDPKTIKKLVEREKRENKLGDQKHGLRVADCIKKADIIIENNAAIEYLYKEIDKISANY